MKKIILTLMMMCSLFAFSQEIKFGAKIGLNLSSLRGDYPAIIEETNSILGFHIGGFAEYQINDKFNFQPELLVSTQGGTATVFFYDTGRKYASFSQTPQLTYIVLPLMLKYKVIDKLSIEFGPQIGYLISAKSKWKAIDFEDSSENFSLEIDLLNAATYNVDGTTFKVDPKTNRFDFGINLGSSYDISSKLFVQLRYNLGLTTIDKNSTYGSSLDSWNLKNSVLQLSTGYKF